MSTHTLILLPDMRVHDIVSWQTSITLQYQGKVDVLEIYEEEVSSPTITMNIPAVVRLRKAVSRNKKAVKFSKLNLFTRDRFCCQYCGVKKGFKELNYDHVVPRVQGGKTDYLNIVASCYRCNTKKDGRTPEQARMPLLNKPYKPTSLPQSPPIIYGRTIPEEWKPYLPHEDSIIQQRTGT
jgi:5-methylcytosine-specific restriction endonuclease McrA